MEYELSLFMSYLTEEKKASSSTISSYRRDLTKLEQYLKLHGIQRLDEITVTNLNSYILFLEKQGFSIATVSRSVASMKSFFHYAFQEKKIDTDPTNRIKAPHVEKKIPGILSQEETKRLLCQPSGDTPKELRDKAMLELLCATGMRVTELISLRLGDLNLTLDYLICRDAGKERVLPFDAPAKEALEHYLNCGREKLLKEKHCDYVFVNCFGDAMSRQGFWKLMKQYAGRAGITQDITPHTLRHSFAVHLVQEGTDLKAVQERMGHSDISTTQIYRNTEKSGMRTTYAPISVQVEV